MYNCKKCGKKHKPRECYAFGKMCGICKKMNHYAVGCKKGNEEKREIHETHYVDDEIFQINTIYDIHQIKTSWTKVIIVNNKNIVFKLDSGSDVIPWAYYKELKPQPKFRHNQCSVESYEGHKKECLGKCVISPECTDNIEFLIVKSSPLMENKNTILILGLESCEKYDLIKRIDMITSNKEIFIKNNIDVFTGLGKFPEPHKIQLKSDAQPKPAPYRRVPQTEIGLLLN